MTSKETPISPFERALILRKSISKVCHDASDLCGLPESSISSFETGQFVEAISSASQCPPSPNHGLFLACCCLSRFLEVNWTGPCDDFATPDGSSIEIDGEEPCPLVREPSLLVRAREHLSGEASRAATAAWWSARVALAHQRVMSNPCASLKSLVDSGFDSAIARFADAGDEELAFSAILERALAHLVYRESSRATKGVSRAMAVIGLRVELAGAMGKRMKYQEKETPQLVLNVVAQRREADPRTFPGLKLPQEAQLEDDSDLMPHVLFTDRIPESVILSPPEQAAILAMCMDRHARTNQQDSIRTEENVAIVERVVRDPTDWSVHAMALLIKSRLESGGTKTVHRALTQLQDLDEMFGARGPFRGSSEVPARARIACHHLVLLPSRGELKRELGRRLVSIGAASAALKVFEEMKMFDEMVACMVASGQKEKAEQLARTRLRESGETPEMLCVLGDVTADKQFYERAWVVSGHRMSRAKRSLGHWCFARSMFAESVAHYREALAINSIHERCWFAMGCAAMQLSEWGTALQAFSRVVSIDPEDGEAWCNIAAVHMHTGRAQEAHASLQEALRQKPDNWKIWQNLVLVSTTPAVRDYRSAMFGIGKLLDLAAQDSSAEPPPKQPDARSLALLVAAVLEDSPTRSGDRGSSLREPLGKLICRIEREAEMGSVLWDIFAVFAEGTGDTRAAYERRGCQCRALEGSWPGDEKRWAAISDAYCSLARDAIALGEISCIPRLRTVIDRAKEKHSTSKQFGDLIALIGELEFMKSQK